MPSEASHPSNLAVDTLDFVDVAQHDFHLRPTSMAVDAGIALPEVSVDHDGTPRPQGIAYDVGAFEWQSVILGDMDCDQDTDFDDIEPFVLGLNDPAGYEDTFGQSATLKGDMDRDGDRDFDDIDGFVAIFSGELKTDPPHSIAEPTTVSLILLGTCALFPARRRKGKAPEAPLF